MSVLYEIKDETTGQVYVTGDLEKTLHDMRADTSSLYRPTLVEVRRVISALVKAEAEGKPYGEYEVYLQVHVRRAADQGSS